MIKIKGAKIVDPGNLNEEKDLVIENGRIRSVLDPGSEAFDTGADIIDAAGMMLFPGLIDIHVHLREPGHEYKETIASGAKAAARGGFTTICCMPNTSPVNDNSQVTTFVRSRADEARTTKVLPVGAISMGLGGESLAEYADMKKAGICAVSDDGRPVENALFMRRALEYAGGLDLPVFSHAEDLSLADGGAMNEGQVSTHLGISGIPNVSESVAVMRDTALCELTGARLHICHVSTKESVETIRQAKKRGVRVTCETAPHYFTLTDRDIKAYDTHYKMTPPLRSEQDRLAVIEGLCDGTIDVIASDHAPHSPVEKDLEFDRAAFGIVGLETSLSLSLKLFHESILTIEQLVEKMAKNPAAILGIENDIKAGATADITLIDPQRSFRVDPDTFFSKSRNTPFKGLEVMGEAFLTMVDGRICYRRER